MKILINAYACEPNQGSEPGVGWNWVVQLAKRHELWVVTKANNKDVIECYIKNHPMPRVHFIYVELPRWASFWKKKQRGIRLYYYLWQFAALKAALRSHKINRFDIGHHITFVNDWLWSFLCLMPIPFVWGPVGSHPPLLPAMLESGKDRLSAGLRINFQRLMRNIEPLYWVTVVRADAILYISDEVKRSLPYLLFGKGKSQYFPSIAVEEVFGSEPKPDDRFRVLFVGRFVALKGVLIALQAFIDFSRDHPLSEFRLIGEGKLKGQLQGMVDAAGAQSQITIEPWADRSEVLEAMRESDVFLFPTMEGAGMVVLEALATGTPIVCLDYGGPGKMVKAETGIKIPLGEREEIVKALAEGLSTLYQRPEKRLAMSKAAIEDIATNHLWSSRCARLKRFIVN